MPIIAISQAVRKAMINEVDMVEYFTVGMEDSAHCDHVHSKPF